MMMHRSFGLAAVLFCLSTLALAEAPFSIREESKKPLGPEAEKALAKFCEEGAPTKQKQLETQMDWVIEEMGKAVTISEDEVKQLKEDAKKVIEEAVANWKKVSAVNLRPYLLTYETDETRAKRVGEWKADQVAEAHSIIGWTLPDLLPSWQAAVKQRLGEERGAKALAAHAAKRAEINREMDAFLERWASTGRVSMDEELRGQIEDMRKDLKLAQAKVDELFSAAKKLVDAHVEAELVAGRQLLNSLAEVQRLKTMGKTNSFNTRFVRPKGTDLETKWAEAAAAVVGVEALKQWQTLVAAQKAKEEAEIVDSLKPSEQQARMQMEELIAREVDGYVTALNLDDERKKKLDALAKQAVDASLVAARKQWVKNIQGWSAAERKNRRSVYFGVNDDDQAPKQTVWADGLKKIFSEDEMKRMQDGLTARKARMTGALAASTLAEMDKTLALSAKQRAELEPLLAPLMESLLRDENQEYWSYQAYQLFNTAARLDVKKLSAILDEPQLKQWQALGSAAPNYSRSAGVTVTSNEVDPEVEPLDVEAEISRHLYELGRKERQRLLELMLAQVGDAKRVLNLPEDKLKRLTTAAKGAVEAELVPWRDNVERWVRGTVERATPATVKATLANLERSTYNAQGKGPQKQDIWRKTVGALLSPSEQAEWRKVLDARKAYRIAAMATMTTNELDRRRRLTPEQFAKVKGLVSGVLDEYLPDIERYMSHAWHLQYYYALLPIAGVKDADLKAALSDRQWKLVQERDLSDAQQYWEGIESYHKQRLEKGGDEEGGSVLFDE